MRDVKTAPCVSPAFSAPGFDCRLEMLLGQRPPTGEVAISEASGTPQPMLGSTRDACPMPILYSAIYFLVWL